MPTISISYEPDTRLGWYTSIFAKDYILAKFEYESRRRNWEVETLGANRFNVVDSNGEGTEVYWCKSIKNCGCQDFIKTETGSCHHITTLDNHAHALTKYTSKPEPGLRLVDMEEMVVRQVPGNGPVTQTPSVPKFLKARQAPPEVPVIDLSILDNQGIKLYSHQGPSITGMLTAKRSILTLKMGLGKTICAIFCTKHLSRPKTLIVCPNNLKYQWHKELQRFEAGTSLVIDKGSDLELYKDQPYLILSYEMLNRHVQKITSRPFDILIADEIQKIKNPESVCWSSLSQIKTEYLFALSGTPIQNTVTDIISILRVVVPGEFEPEWKFYEKYCRLSRTRVNGWTPDGLRELKRRLKTIVINPKINWAEFQFPAESSTKIECGISDKQLLIHDGYFQQARLLLAKSSQTPLSFAERQVLNGLLLNSRRAASDARLFEPEAEKSDRFQKIEEVIQQKVKDGQKVVVYSDWIDCLRLLDSSLQLLGIKAVMFHGEIPAKRRDRNLQDFIDEGSVMVFLSTDSGGLGIDGLQLASSTVIHVEDVWNPAKLKQRNGRLVRALQKAPVVEVFQFSSPSGIEQMMATNKDFKNQVIDEFES